MKDVDGAVTKGPSSKTSKRGTGWAHSAEGTETETETHAQKSNRE